MSGFGNFSFGEYALIVIALMGGGVGCLLRKAAQAS